LQWQGTVTVNVIESGERWWHVKTASSDLDPKYYMLALVRAVVDSGRLPTFAQNADEMALFATNNVTTLVAPTFVIGDDGYNSGNLLIGKFGCIFDEFELTACAVANPRLDGVQLQWKRLFLPYALNFVQYRRVANLTTSLTGNDFSAYTTLPMVFENARTLDFEIPKSTLLDGVYYEFRLGFAFSTFTYYTNTRVLKTYDANSPFVGKVKTSTTNSSISVIFDAPEYFDGVVGYSARLLYKDRGNGDVVNPQWPSSLLTVVESRDLSLTDTEVVFGCIEYTADNCLFPFTMYAIELTVIREKGRDAPKTVYVATKVTTKVVVKRDRADLFLHGKRIDVTFLAAVPMYASNTAIGSTLFGAGAYLTNRKQDINLTLSSSTVASVSSTSVQITLSDNEYATLVSKVRAADFVFSTMYLHYGEGKTIEMGTYCLL
jgi:hypothetical protein